MKKNLLPVLFFYLLALYSCNNEPSNHPEKSNGKEIVKPNSLEGKSASLIDVNNNDGFEENGFGGIDSVVIQELFEGVFSGTYKAVKDDSERKSLSKEEIIAELKNGYNKTIVDAGKKNFFIEVDGEKIPMRDILQILTKDSLFLQEPGFNLLRKTQEIAIVAQTYDQEGNERGKRILFWIILSEQKNV